MKKDSKVKAVMPLVLVVIIGIIGCIVLNVFLKERLNINLAGSIDPNVSVEQEEKVDIEKYDVPENMSATVPIFMYHFILADYGNYPDTQNFLKPETLEEQLKYISENGYETIYIDELDELYRYEKPVALTFDDCFVYFYNNAFPLLKKYNQKATIFIITNYINGENYLTEEQLKEIADSGLVKVESHTLSHSYLSEMTDEEQDKEMRESKEILENITGKKVSVVAYPSGEYTASTADIAAKYYDFGLNMLGGVYHSDQVSGYYHIPRIYANRDMPLSEFASYLSQAKVVIN